MDHSGRFGVPKDWTFEKRCV